MKLLKSAMAAAVIAAAATVAVTAGAASAQQAKYSVQARQAMMSLNAHYISRLGAMAKGKAPYDAAAASAAANGLLALSHLDQSAMWPEGSGEFDFGKKTAAKEDIWMNNAAFLEKTKAMADAAAVMAEAAGGGLDKLRGAMPTLGGGCGGCHKQFRADR